MLEPFWSPNRVKMQLMLEQRVCAFAWVLVLFWDVGSLRFLHRFFIVFLIDFGIVLGGFLGRYSELFGRHVTNFRAGKRHCKKKAFQDTPETNDKWVERGRPRVDRGSTEGRPRVGRE